MSTTPASVWPAPALLTEPITLTLGGSDLAVLNRYRQADHACQWARAADPVRRPGEAEAVWREYQEAREALVLAIGARVRAELQEIF